MDANKKQIEIGEKQKHPEDTTRNKSNGKTQKASGEESLGDGNANTTTVPILRNTPEENMGVGPLPGEGITFEPISMELEEANNMVGGKEPSATSIFCFMYGRGLEGVGAKKSMGVPGSRVEGDFVTLMITHFIENGNKLSVERLPAQMIRNVETRAEMC